jgi:hypothetical protein
MVKAFTISFEFEGRTYLALASQRVAENEMFYSVRVYDDSLARIIPARQFTYSNKKQVCPSSLKHPDALRLFTRINEAVSCHLQAAQLNV